MTVCARARIREIVRGRERGERRGSGVASFLDSSFFCERLTGAASDGRTNLRRSRTERRHPEVKNKTKQNISLKPVPRVTVSVCVFLFFYGDEMRPSFPSALGIFGERGRENKKTRVFLSPARLLFGTAAWHQPAHRNPRGSHHFNTLLP